MVEAGQEEAAVNILYECAQCGAALPLQEVVAVRVPEEPWDRCTCDERVVGTPRTMYMCLACKERR